MISWGRDFGKFQLSQRASFETSIESELLEEVFFRFGCAVLLNQVPREGLPELVRTIREIVEFYSGRQDPRYLPSAVTTVKAGISERLDRPTLAEG